jgi:beta-lactamase superfamily II metal-dependent hydrolase
MPLFYKFSSAETMLQDSSLTKVSNDLPNADYSIKFLKAGGGDSILISSEKANILIDGGDDITHLLKELKSIHQKQEVLNHLIITHHDSDHVKGVIELLKFLQGEEFGDPQKFIQRIYMNSPQVISQSAASDDDGYLSYKQFHELESLIKLLGIDGPFPLNDFSDALRIGQVKLTCLSPTQEILDKYLSKTPEKYLELQVGGDWGKSLKDLEQYVNDKSLDSRLSNKSSIVLLFEHKESKGLLTADVTARRLEEIIEKLFSENLNNVIDFDFFKMPHHGSSRNFTSKCIAMINCKKYVISTDGNNSFLPNKKALLKVLNNQLNKNSQLEFLFNYSETIDYLNLTESEKFSYKISLSPNNFANGYCI